MVEISKKIDRLKEIVKRPDCDLEMTQRTLKFIHKRRGFCKADKQVNVVETKPVVEKSTRTQNNKLSQKIRSGMHIRSDEKYKDELFPPITSSLFRGGITKNKNLKMDTIRWVRLADLFKDKKMCLLPKGRSYFEIYCNQWK